MKPKNGICYRTRDGEKVGPMNVPPTLRSWDDCVFADDSSGRGWLANGAYQISQQPHSLDLIAEWVDEPAATQPAGPVRTITRKEIVPGVYGVVDLDGIDDNQVQIRLRNTGELKSWFDAAELRAAIATLSEIADAMEENSK